MKRKPTIRFAVRNASGQTSETWRCWSGRDGSVYLAPRALAHAFKASFHAVGDKPHQTGDWQLALNDAFAKAHLPADGLPGNRGRFISRTPRAAETRPGVRVAARIAVPPRAVSLPAVANAQGFDWIPAPSRGLSVEVLLVLTSFVPFHGHPGDAAGFKLLSFRVVPPGAFWLVYKTGKLRDSGAHRSRKVFSTTSDEPGPGWRAIAFQDEGDGSRSFVELVVG